MGKGDGKGDGGGEGGGAKGTTFRVGGYGRKSPGIGHSKYRGGQYGIRHFGTSTYRTGGYRPGYRPYYHRSTYRPSRPTASHAVVIQTCCCQSVLINKMQSFHSAVCGTWWLWLVLFPCLLPVELLLMVVYGLSDVLCCCCCTCECEDHGCSYHISSFQEPIGRSDWLSSETEIDGCAECCAVWCCVEGGADATEVWHTDCCDCKPPADRPVPTRQRVAGTEARDGVQLAPAGAVMQSVSVRVCANAVCGPTRNEPHLTVCVKCQSPLPEPVVQQIAVPTHQWTCACGFSTEGKAFCGKCGAAKPADAVAVTIGTAGGAPPALTPASSASAAPVLFEWQCPKCHFANRSASGFCGQCGGPNPMPPAELAAVAAHQQHQQQLAMHPMPMPVFGPGGMLLASAPPPPPSFSPTHHMQATTGGAAAHGMVFQPIAPSAPPAHMAAGAPVANAMVFKPVSPVMASPNTTAAGASPHPPAPLPPPPRPHPPSPPAH